MQETWVRSLIWEESTCLRALSSCATTVEPVLQRLGGATTEAHMPQSLCSTTREVTAMRSLCTSTKSSPCLPQLEKSPHSTKTHHSQKKKSKCVSKRASIRGRGGTTKRYHITLFRMAIIKKSTITTAGEDVEKREPSCTVGGNENWYSHYGGSLTN